jgi:uncharacterized protein
MPLEQFQNRIESAAELREMLGPPSPISLKKELKSLDHHMRRFISLSPFVLVGTHNSAGRCDVSPRGDAPGFVTIVDDHTLLIPDRAGNKRVDSFHNVLETGRAGLIFLVPGFGETLRVNGRACLIRDEAWLKPMTAQSKQPIIAMAVEAEECFLQCAKAIFRSKLWDPHEKPSPEQLACAGEMLAEQVQMPEYDAVKMQTMLDEAYRTKLY